MKLRLILPGPCPYNCFYCYKEGVFTDRKDQMETSDLVYLTEKAGEIGFDQFKATGGEPTNYLGLRKILQAARNSNFADIRMTTIGLKLADREFCESLRGDGLDGVTISVNTFNSKTYKKMTGARPGDFETMMEGLKNAVDIFGHSVTLNTVLNKWNAKEIPELIEYASKKGLGVKVLEMLDEKGITPPDVYVSLSEFKREEGIKGGKMINPTRELVRIGGARVYLVNSCCARKECNICRKGYNVVRVTSDGKIKTCISNESNELSALNEIKRRDDKKVRQILLKVTEKFTK